MYSGFALNLFCFVVFGFFLNKMCQKKISQVFRVSVGGPLVKIAFWGVKYKFFSGVPLVKICISGDKYHVIGVSSDMENNQWQQC